MSTLRARVTFTNDGEKNAREQRRKRTVKFVSRAQDESQFGTLPAHCESALLLIATLAGDHSILLRGSVYREGLIVYCESSIGRERSSAAHSILLIATSYYDCHNSHPIHPMPADTTLMVPAFCIPMFRAPSATSYAHRIIVDKMTMPILLNSFALHSQTSAPAIDTLRIPIRPNER